MQFPPLLWFLLIPEQKEKPSELEQQLKKAEAAQRRRMQVEKAARESEVCFCVILFHSLSFFISYVRSNRNISVWIESCRVRLSEKFLVKSLAGKNGKINLKSARENWHRYCIRLDEFSLFSIWF